MAPPKRTRRLVRWLEMAAADNGVVFLVGDLFDFWFEYKTVVPRGYVRLLGKLAEISDKGIPIHYFTGNHDMWIRDYFQEELNIDIYHQPAAFDLGGSHFLIGHGDGLGPGDHKYKFLKRIFRNPLAQWLFGILPPTIGIGLADFFSRFGSDATSNNISIYFYGPNDPEFDQRRRISGT